MREDDLLPPLSCADETCLNFEVSTTLLWIVTTLLYLPSFKLLTQIIFIVCILLVLSLLKK